MKRSFKKFRNCSKFLYNINFGQTHYSHYSRNSKTFDRKSNSSFRKENSSSNLIQPEIEYVTKLNFFIPKSPNIENKKTSNLFIENKIMEKKLENRRKELEDKIIKIKTDLKPLNDELTKIISELDNLKLDYEVLQNNKTCSIIEKTIKKNLISNHLIFQYGKRNSLPLLPNKKNVEEKYKIESILSQHKRDMRSKKNFALMKSVQLWEKKKELINKIKSYEKDLKSFREEKNKIRNELISHYHNILHEGKDIRKDGLSWVIQAIWNLKSEVLPSYLPKFLDEESISFLFNYSSQKIQLKEMYKTVQKINKKINEERNNTNFYLNKYETVEQNLFNFYENDSEENKENNKNKWNINSVMNKINKKINFNFIVNSPQTKKISDYTSDRNPSVDNNRENMKNNNSFNKIIFKTGGEFQTCGTNGEVYELYNRKKILEKKIYKLKKEIKSLIESELERLNKCLYKDENENKFNMDKNKIIYTVVGEENARSEISKQINESRNYLNILNQLKKEKVES